MEAMAAWVMALIGALHFAEIWNHQGWGERLETPAQLLAVAVFVMGTLFWGLALPRAFPAPPVDPRGRSRTGLPSRRPGG
jgi:hypothetical protein